MVSSCPSFEVPTDAVDDKDPRDLSDGKQVAVAVAVAGRRGSSRFLLRPFLYVRCPVPQTISLLKSPKTVAMLAPPSSKTTVVDTLLAISVLFTLLSSITYKKKGQNEESWGRETEKTTLWIEIENGRQRR